MRYIRYLWALADELGRLGDVINRIKRYFNKKITSICYNNAPSDRTREEASRMSTHDMLNEDSRTPHPPLPELTPETYINRELSLIDFQRRVLELAKDESIPLLERVKFLAIVGNNIDEFFMVRVPGYIQKVKLGIVRTRPDGIPPQTLMQMIHKEISDLIQQQRETMSRLFTLLKQENIAILSFSDLDADERRAVREYFKTEVFPILTPLAVDHARPFPFISNLSLNLGVHLERYSEENDEIETEFARIKVPVQDSLPRLVSLNQVLTRYGADPIDGHKFLWIEDIIIDSLDVLFPGMTIAEAFPFRVLRNSDIDYEMEQEDDEILDVAAIIEHGVRERRFGFVARVSVPNTISERMLTHLLNGLEVREETGVYLIDGHLGSANLFELAAVDRPDLKYPAYVPRYPDAFQPDGNIFESIRRQDILVHHPYDSFTPVEEFFKQAAHDPDVVAIKATLYRVGKNSPIVQQLMEARDNDKQVTVLVELKARFDEENNLEWARQMEAKGVHVLYGVEELPVKTHAKVSLVVRREGAGIRRYVHLGTGNYNASTARLYTDLGLLTCNPELADDASRLFNRLTGYGPETHYNRLLVAPEYLTNTLIALIDNEIEAARAGKDAGLVFKMNQLEEDVMIQKLYEASQAGVQIDLIVRGICCLRPGLPGISENIRLRSIVGRFLEHSRIYYFQNAPLEQQFLLGSADLMRRNLYNRVEVVFPIFDQRLREKLLRLLATSLRDNTNTWELRADGKYYRLQPDNATVNSQEIFTRRSFGLLMPNQDNE
ncbi:polyphosphate kinase 1 [Phototrophicus methaneseepsis]|nr:polyphosphate kinase 1 [Phototrophicus methaneseepsis]